MSEEILRTTGNNFDGYNVDKYIDVISEEVIFRNGFAKQIVASVKDYINSFNIFDTEIKGATSLIENGKKYVMERFTKKAKALGANAILGIQFESSFGVEVIRIAISGTAVRVSQTAQKIIENRVRLPVKGTNDTPFKCAAIICKTVENTYSISLDIYNPQKKNITGIKCDVVLHTSFHDITLIKNQTFIHFEEDLNNHFVSEQIICDLPKDLVKILNYANVVVKKYLIDDSVILIEYKEITSEKDCIEYETTNSNTLDTETMLEEIQNLSSAKEIYDYISAIAESSEKAIPGELLALIKRYAVNERLYGNEKEDCILAFRRQFGIFY